MRSSVQPKNQFHRTDRYNAKCVLHDARKVCVLHGCSVPTLSSCSLRRRWISLTTVSFCLSECSGSSKISFLHSSMASFRFSMSDATSEPCNGNAGTKEKKRFCVHMKGLKVKKLLVHTRQRKIHLPWVWRSGPLLDPGPWSDLNCCFWSQGTAQVLSLLKKGKVHVA